MCVILGLTVWFIIQLFVVMFAGWGKAIYAPSFDKDIALMHDLDLQSGKTIIDLWCGDGKALRFFARRYGLKGLWYDCNLQAIRYGKLINFLTKQSVRLIHSDFSAADFGQADYIYLYLFPEQILDIEDRVFSSIKKGTVVITNTFHFGKHTPFQIVKNRKGKGRICLYRK